jgi:hypothetical protein
VFFFPYPPAQKGFTSLQSSCPTPKKEKLPPSPARERIKTFTHSFKEF